jgi:hypothetical protein
MASTSGGLFGNLMLHLKQGANSFHTYYPQGECVEWWTVQKQKMSNLFEFLIKEEFKLQLNEIPCVQG